MQNTFEPPISRCPDVRPCIDQAIRLALDKDRERRPGSVREFTAILTGDKKPTTGVTLPATVNPPKAKPVPKLVVKSPNERRANLRHRVELEAKCRTLGNARQTWPAWIIDFSLAGICLRMPRRFEIGSLLEVTFALQGDTSPKNQLARVRWVQTSESKTWLLGCEFANPITDEEINTIIADGMDTTNMT